MTLLERKAEFIKVILNNVDEEVLNELETIYYAGITDSVSAPCTYSVEEQKERTKRAIKESQEGNVISHADMKKRFSV